MILDEPSQGLAPLIVREVFRIVQQMKAEGISVLLVEQNARMSLEIADDAYVLDDGIVVYSGTGHGTCRRRSPRPRARRRQRRGMDAGAIAHPLRANGSRERAPDRQAPEADGRICYGFAVAVLLWAQEPSAEGLTR